jgi:hypothetical protein
MVTRGLLNATFLQLTRAHAWKIMEKDTIVKEWLEFVATQFFLWFMEREGNF